MLSTGDPEWDEIEKRIHAGEDPDLVFADWDVGEPIPTASPEAPQFEEPVARDEYGDIIEDEFTDEY